MGIGIYKLFFPLYTRPTYVSSKILNWLWI